MQNTHLGENTHRIFKFHFPKEAVYTVLESLQEQGISINTGKLDIEMPDAKDVVFYEVVMEKRKKDLAYLVTGNIKHFPKESFGLCACVPPCV